MNHHKKLLNSIVSSEQNNINDFEKRLFQRIAGHHVPIIAMMANAMQEYREKCVAAGMDEYMTEPLMPE